MMDKLKLAGLVHDYLTWTRQWKKSISKQSINEFLKVRRVVEVENGAMWYQVSDEAARKAEKYLLSFTNLEEVER